MRTKVQQWGNSLAVRIPKAFAEAARLSRDSAVRLKLEDSRLIIEPLDESIPTLDELLAGITEENIHPPTDWGPPVGKEIW